MINRTSDSQGLPLVENTGTKGTLDPCPSTIAIQRADNDPEHPYNLSSRRKWLAVITVSLSSLCV